MNIMVVYAHPYDGSFCKGLLDTVTEHLESRGANVKVKDLVKMGFDCTMEPENLAAKVTGEYTPDVAAEQADVLWADAIVTICPVWFGMCPGFLKGYFDKVFMTGFAYGEDGIGKLTGKRVYSMFTFGTNQPFINIARQSDALEIVWDEIFGMTGFDDVCLKYFGGVTWLPDEVRAGYLEEAKEFVDQIFDKEPGEAGQVGYANILSRVFMNLYETSLEVPSTVKDRM